LLIMDWFDYLDRWAEKHYENIKQRRPDLLAGNRISLPSILEMLPKNRFRETVALRIAFLALREKNAKDFRFYIRSGEDE